MQTLTPMFGSGVKYSLPADKVDSFKQDFGEEAEDGVSLRTKDGQSYTIPRSKEEAFKVDFPDAQEVRTFQMADGTKRQMTIPEVSKFIRSDEYRKSQDFADERKRIEASLPAPTVQEDGRTFSDELSASGGGAVGKTVGGVVAGLFSAFGQQLRNAAVASPLGMPGQTIHGGDPKKVQASMQNNAADRAGNVVREWTDILFPDVEASNGFQEANKKAVEFGTGLAKFGIMASNPLSLAALVAESYGNAATETFDTSIRNGMSVEDASGLANIRGMVDAGITCAFAGAPVKRLAGALGLKTPEVAAPQIASVIKNGVGAAKNSLSAGIAKAMAVEAGKAAIEMGSLSFAQGMFDNAVMQEAEHPDQPIDWMAAAKAGGIDGLEQATVGAVLGLLPTPVRISRARRGIEKGMRDALATPEGAEAYYAQNREGAAGLIKAFNKNGKISRTDAREAGLPEMSEVERNELAQNLTERLKAEVAPAVEKQTVAEERRAAEAKMEAEGHKAASPKGMEERAQRKAEMEEYERAEAERKAREAEEEATLQPQEVNIKVNEGPDAPKAVADNAPRTEAYPEYATWLKHNFRADTDKNWNRFVAENGLDPALKVERGRKAKPSEVKAEEAQPVAETPVAEKPVEVTAEKPVETPVAETPVAKVHDGKGKMVEKPIATETKEVSQTTEATPKPDGNADIAMTDKALRHADITDSAKKTVAESFGSAKVVEEGDDFSVRSARMKVDGKDAEVRYVVDKKSGKLARIDISSDVGAVEESTPRPDGKGRMKKVEPVETQYNRAVKAVESAEKESANARSFDELADINSRARSALGKITMEQENELMARLDKAWKDNKGRVENVRSQGGYTPSKELIEAKSRIEAMPTFTNSEKAAKKKAQKDWLLSSVDDAIKSHGDTRTINDNPFAESFADEFESLIRRRNATYERDKLDKLNKQIDTAKKTMAQGEMLTFDVPDDGTFKIRNNPEALALFKRMVQKRLSPTNLKEGTLAKAEKPLAEDVKDAGIGKKETVGSNEKASALNIDVPRTPEAEIADRTSMHRLDPKLRGEPAVLAWAKKRGRVVDNGMVTADARREYDREQAMGAAKLSRNWFPNMKVTYHDYGENVKRGQHVLDLRDRSGNTLGWFDPNSKEVHLLPGANAETVAHEIMWHGTRDWAKTESAKGNAEATRLLNKMHEVENACPASLKKAILRAYRKTGVTDPDTLLNEFGAWDAMVNGGKALGKELQKRENAVWYARWWNAAKDLIKSYLARHGKNRVDFTDIDGMTTDEFKDFLAEQFAGGKTLGEIVPKAGKTVSTDETKLQKARRIIYDVNAANRDMERDIEKTHGVKIKFDESVEAANALTPGLREAELLATSASEREYREILDAGNLSNADVEAYMGAKAAAGRDAKVDAKKLAQIAKDVERDLRAEWGTDKIAKDTAAFDAELQNRVASAQAAYNSTNGSHIDPREARVTVHETETGSHAADYANARAKLRAVMDETLQVQKDAGLISEELYNKLKTEEPDYVPFKNEYDVETGEAYGRGINNFTKPEFYEAHGRQSAAGDIVTHIFQDNLAAKHRAIENGVRDKLARLVERFPELGTVEKIGEAWKEKQKSLSDRKDKTNQTGDPNVVMFKRNGDTYAIRLNGERGAAIAASITERNVMRFSDLLGGKAGNILNKFSRFQAGLATRYAPFFAFRNLPKDNIELGNIVLSERGLLEGLRWIKNYVSSYKETGGALSKFVLTGKVDASTPGGQVLQRYIDAGGLISGGGTEGYDAHSIRKRMDTKFIEKEMKRGRSKTYATLQYAKRGLGYLSEMSELMTRVNAFNAELKAGKSDGEAALFSRRATVDFNRHGELTGVTNVLRLFSNSTLGATARATAALANSKGGRSMAAILFANGMARVALEHLMNDEDDKGREAAGTGTGKDVPEYERQTSLFYVRNGENIFKIAEHESPFSLITYAGDTLARVLYGDISVGQAAKNLGISTAEVAFHLTGLGNINLTSREGGLESDSKAALVSLAPSLVQPAVEVITGIDYKGDLISMQLFDPTDVRSHHPRANTPDYQVKTAQFLNRITGGNAGRRGYADLSPEAVGKLIEGYGKNALREGLMAYDLAKAMVGDKKWSEIDVGQKPLVRDWVRPIRGNTNRYYDAKRTRKEDRKDFDENRAAMSVEERYAYAKAHPSAVGRRSEAMGKLETSIQRLQKMARGFAYKNGKAVPHEWSEEEVKEFEKRRLELQAKYLKLMETQKK